MPLSFAPRELASSSGIVIAEDGAYLLIYDRRLGGPAVATFVTGLVLAILVLQAVVFTVLSVAGDGSIPPALGAGLIAGALIPLAGLIPSVRALRRRQRADLAAMTPKAVFDRAGRVMLDPDGALLAPLHAVRIDRRLRLTSSSPDLVAHLPDRTIVLGQASPFAGGLGNLHITLHDLITGTGGAPPPPQI